MADIALLSQIVAAPELSIGFDASDYDIWLREQFPAAPDFSVYPTERPVSPPVAAGGAVANTLDASPGALTLTGAAASLTVARMLTAAPGALTLTGASATFSVGHILTADPGALMLSGAAAAFDYVPGQSAVVGGHFAEILRVPDRKRPPLDRDELRRMLEAAFADAPADPVIVTARREHRLEATDAAKPRVDWSRMLADLSACAEVLTRYAGRIDSGKTRTQRGEAAREELPYSSDSIDEMIAAIRAQIAARREYNKRVHLLLLAD